MNVSSEMIVAVLSLLGTLAGSLLGIISANKLTNYRIDKLEERIDDIEKLNDRIDKIETEQVVQRNDIEHMRTEINRNISDIKELKHNG